MAPALEALIEEEFRDGIMSTIDFDMEISRQPDPKGDRVKIGLTGKFLPFNITAPRAMRWPMGLRRSRGRAPDIGT